MAKEIDKLHSDLPETMKLKEAELAAQKRRLANFIEAIGEGRDSKALAKAVTETERLLSLQEVLEAHTEQSALLLREILGPIHLEPVEEGEEHFYRARTAIDTLALVETPLAGTSEEGGSSALRQWRRPELNRRPWS